MFSRALVIVLALGGAVVFAKEPERDLPRNEESHKYQYQEVVPAEGASAADLFVRAKTWVATEFRSAKDVIQLDDKESGQLIVKAIMPESYLSQPVNFWFTTTIEVKDGRFRYTITDLVFDCACATNYTAPLEFWLDKQPFTKGVRKRLLDDFDRTIAGLKKAMAEATVKKNDQW